MPAPESIPFTFSRIDPSAYIIGNSVTIIHKHCSSFQEPKPNLEWGNINILDMTLARSSSPELESPAHCSGLNETGHPFSIGTRKENSGAHRHHGGGWDPKPEHRTTDGHLQANRPIMARAVSGHPSARAGKERASPRSPPNLSRKVSPERGETLHTKPPAATH